MLIEMTVLVYRLLLAICHMNKCRRQTVNWQKIQQYRRRRQSRWRKEKKIARCGCNCHPKIKIELTVRVDTVLERTNFEFVTHMCPRDNDDDLPQFDAIKCGDNFANSSLLLLESMAFRLMDCLICTCFSGKEKNHFSVHSKRIIRIRRGFPTTKTNSNCRRCEMPFEIN